MASDGDTFGARGFQAFIKLSGKHQVRQLTHAVALHRVVPCLRIYVIKQELAIIRGKAACVHYAPCWTFIQFIKQEACQGKWAQMVNTKLRFETVGC